MLPNILCLQCSPPSWIMAPSLDADPQVDKKKRSVYCCKQTRGYIQAQRSAYAILQSFVSGRAILAATVAHEEQGRIKIARTRSQDGLTRKVFQSVWKDARLDLVVLETSLSHVTRSHGFRREAPRQLQMMYLQLLRREQFLLLITVSTRLFAFSDTA